VSDVVGNERLSTVLVASLVVLMAAATGGAAVGSAAIQSSSPTIGFSDVTDSIAVGNSDSATVGFANVSDGDGVGSFTVNVTYDPAAAVSVSASGTGAFEVETSSPEPGVLRVTGYTDQYPGPTDEGTLFGLSVTGEDATDSVSLDLETETFTDADGDDLTPVSTGSATLAVESDDDGGDGGGGGGGGGQPGGGPGGEVEITDRALLDDTVATGEQVFAQVELANFDPADGELTLTLTVDGSSAVERTVTVGASSRKTVHLRTRFGTAGTYELAINGESIGSVTVEADSPTPTVAPGTATRTPGPTPTTSPPAIPVPTEEPSTPTEAEPTTEGDGAGFGVVAAVVALGLALLAARRRN
jgi:PGF-CTERM protein